MAGTFLTGPSIVAGPLFGYGTTPEYGVEFGPSISYQGDALPDVRFSMNKDNPVSGSIPGYLNSPYICMTDAAPAASAAAPLNLAAAANVTSGTAMTLVSANGAGISCNVPVQVFGTNSTIVSTAICLDFGFSTINVTSGSATATPLAGTISQYSPGMSVVIAVNATNVFFTTIVTVGASTVTLSATAPATNATAPIGTSNIWQNPLPPNQPVATAHVPFVGAGLVRLLDPTQSIMRGVGIQGSASATGGAFTVRGYDIYGQPVSEVITHAGGNVVTWGIKTYKWIASVTPGFTDAHNYSVGTSDLFGFALRSDKWEFTNLFWNGGFQTASSSTTSLWTKADLTSPATTATGDTRGTFQVSSRGPQAGVTSTAFSDGTKRLGIFASIPLNNLIQATATNAVPMFGVTPA